MSLSDVRLLRTLRITEQKGDKQTKQYTATEDYLLIHSQKNPSFAAALADESTWPNLNGQKLPQIDDEVQLNGIRFYCSARDLAYYQDNERALVMTVRYDAKDEDDDNQPEPPNSADPNAWKRVTIASTQITEPCRGYRSYADSQRAGNGQAVDQKPAINSAGDPVDGIEEESSLIRLAYTNTQVPALRVNFERLRFFVNKCNTGVFNPLNLGASFYTVKCTGFSAEYDQKNNVWSVTVEFLYNPKGWQITFYDVGFNEIVDGKRRAILDLAGNPVSKPVALDGAGKAVAINTGYDTETGVPAEPAVRTIWPYEAVDLSTLFAQAGI